MAGRSAVTRSGLDRARFPPTTSGNVRQLLLATEGETPGRRSGSRHLPLAVTVEASEQSGQSVAEGGNGLTDSQPLCRRACQQCLKGGFPPGSGPVTLCCRDQCSEPREVPSGRLRRQQDDRRSHRQLAVPATYAAFCL